MAPQCALGMHTIQVTRRVYHTLVQQSTLGLTASPPGPLSRNRKDDFVRGGVTRTTRSVTEKRSL